MYNYYDDKRVKESHERIIKAFRMEEVDHVPIWEFTNDPIYPLGSVMFDEEVMLEQLLHNIELTMKHKTDYCPVLYPWHGTGVYAEAFGAEIEWPENDYPWAKPYINDPMDIYKIKVDKPGKSFLTGKVIKTIEHFMKKTKSRIPITCTDPQSPFSVASEIWQIDKLIIALYTNPKEVHHLLDMITDYFIEFTELQLNLIENVCYPGFNFPIGEKGLGISLCDDLAALLSPELYMEFCIPYNTRIAKHFGGICIHSCGNILHNIPNILEIPGIKAINFHCSPYEVDPIKGREMVKGKCALYTAPSIPEVGFKEMESPTMQKIYEEYFIPKLIKNDENGLIITGFGTYWGSTGVNKCEQDKRYDWILKTIKQISAIN